MSNQEPTRPTEADAQGDRRYVIWPGSPQGLPQQEPTVKVIFHGLLCLFFNGKAGCHVGTHNTSASVGHTHPHRYVVTIWKRVNGVCQQAPDHHHEIGDPKGVPRLDINVTNPDLLDGTYVFAKDPFTRPDADNVNDPHDWRWVIDFDDLYPTGVSIRPNTVEHGVTINNGLFYTLRNTCSKFLLRPAGQPPGVSDTPLGSVAHYVAANIYLTPEGRVTLSGGPFQNLPPLGGEPGVTYQIDITNNCNDGQQGCEFKPDAPQPQGRSDFFLYYDVFDRGTEGEFELILSEPCPRLPDFDLEFEEMGVCPSPNVRSSDDAPCGATGFGRTTFP